jgi:Lon-like ATP-dependent protease
LHDPLQSGGLGTPAHLRVQAGAIHRAHNGVLFIDEVATLDAHSQQELLTTLQEKKYPITGQSERSSGAMVRTKPVPCDFTLVAAGNTETVQKMHPALRSRIRGYGYEVYMNDTLPNTPETRMMFARFIAQEVAKDGKIPHFSRAAVEEIIKDARRRAGSKGKLTLILRDLGGLVRAAGDVALEDSAKVVEANHVLKAKKLARTLEQQITDKYLEKRKEYEVIKTEGSIIGRVNGLAVIGTATASSGTILPIEAEVTTSTNKSDRKRFVATGKLGQIAKEAITNVSAIIKKRFGHDIKKYETYVQFLQTADAGVEGDSASAAVAIAVLSALKKLPVRQDTAITGSLSVRGEILPVGGVTQKVEAAIEAGLKQVILPEANLADVVLPNGKSKIKIIPVKKFEDIFPSVFTKHVRSRP